MEWTEKQIRYIIQDMAEEDTLACKALFSISDILFTTEVGSMAVSLSEQPLLMINPDFCNKYLEDENDVKAVLLHEFLHVLLLHTEKYDTADPMLNIALDAIINSIIYRYKGIDYAKLFVRLYEWKPITLLLRVRKIGDHDEAESDWRYIHEDIYDGKYSADDLYELLKYLREKYKPKNPEKILFLGNHSPRSRIHENNQDLLDEILKKMDGTRIWNKSRLPGTGNSAENEQKVIERRKINQWKQSTRQLLNRFLIPQKDELKKTGSREASLPMISPIDRRALGRFKYSGFVPLSIHHFIQEEPAEKATVYLDVSGSMDREIDLLISLLYEFREMISRPMFVFSDGVHEAMFKKGRLVYKTSYGTRIEPVFEHMRRNRIRKCIIVTDGYVEQIVGPMMAGIDQNNIRILLSANGYSGNFESAGIPWQQLDKISV